MNMYVLNDSFRSIGILDVYKSLIWTDRYYKCGDFEVYTVASNDIFDTMQIGYYLISTNSEHAMVIETVELQSDAESGDHVTISGRSLESILDRRIVWGTIVMTGNLQNAIEKLLNENVISPSIPGRQIPNFIFKRSDDPLVTNLTIDSQYTGDNVYDVISAICEVNKIGFKLTFDKDYKLIFELYAGVDRTYEQIKNPHIVFSPEFDNILNSNFMLDISNYKNVTLIGGEDQGASRRYQTKELDSKLVGLERREMFTDARDISSNNQNGGTIPADQYNLMLQQRGLEKLYENLYSTTFDGQTETGLTFDYGVDYFIGDLVNISDDYEHSSVARITEFIISEDDSGFFQYPTFEAEE